MAQRHSFNMKVKDNDNCLTAGGSLISELSVLFGTGDSNSSLESRGNMCGFCNVWVFVNMCTGICCVLYCVYCLVCIVSIMYIYSYLFCLY